MDGKFFQRGKVQEFEAALAEASKDTSHAKKKQILKKIIANMTMGNSMLALAPHLTKLLSIPDLELKKMIYLYIVTYCPIKPDLAEACFGILQQDTKDENPLIRALSLRTLSNLRVDLVLTQMKDPLLRVN
jgi:vesicle coat complex subunit